MGLYSYLPRPLQNPFVTEGHNQYEEAPDGSTRKLSAKHHEESVAFDLKHEKEHAKDRKKHQKALAKLRTKGKT